VAAANDAYCSLGSDETAASCRSPRCPCAGRANHSKRGRRATQPPIRSPGAHIAYRTTWMPPAFVEIFPPICRSLRPPAHGNKTSGLARGVLNVPITQAASTVIVSLSTSISRMWFIRVRGDHDLGIVGVGLASPVQSVLPPGARLASASRRDAHHGRQLLRSGRLDDEGTRPNPIVAPRLHHGLHGRPIR